MTVPANYGTEYSITITSELITKLSVKFALKTL